MILFFPQHKIEGFFLMKNVLNREINLTLCVVHTHVDIIYLIQSQVMWNIVST